MSTHTSSSTAERFGHGLARLWRSYLRLEQRLARWLAAQRIPMAGVEGLLWVGKLAVLGMLVYVTSWIAILLAVVIAMLIVAGQGDSGDAPDLLGLQEDDIDHRDGLFYHPASHHDAPDPRFEDD